MRRKPYTEIGIRRKRCVRCGGQATSQWNACSLNNYYVPTCAPCDVELNALVLEFYRMPYRRRLIAKYRRERLG